MPPTTSSLSHRRSKEEEETAVVVIPENGRSVAGRPLPPVAKKDASLGTILLFYQYKEPKWTDKEHTYILKRVINLGERHGITGRGRVAPEGLNCTLSSKDPHSMRDFVQGLRALDELFFRETDFKLTDGVPHNKLFKSLSIRKTVELVAYGLENEKAPSLSAFSAKKLQAHEYHEAMQDSDTIIIDVRNAYESALGRFEPPSGGATLVDPKMRNSIEFPKWLAAEAPKLLHKKKVLMYCTGGIRCERATALLNQMSAVSDVLQPTSVHHLQGGIERYLKTYPEGGFWKGKNYLFDKRMEQVPSEKSTEKVEEETQSKCCVCRQPCTSYRGKFKCCKGLCGVPVIVCSSCQSHAKEHSRELTCELCKIGYRAPKAAPDLVGMKRTADQQQEEDAKRQKTTTTTTNFKTNRYFISKLPLTTTKTKLEEALGKIAVLVWMTDKKTKAFYGSCMLEISDDAQSTDMPSHIVVDKKRAKVSPFRENNNNDPWPPANHQEREYPPIGT